MVNIIVIAHAEIANSFAKCIEHILAKQIANLHILAVKETEEAENILLQVRQLVNQLSKDGEILILTDVFGATPSNIATQLIKKNQVELITGLNLPMLIRAISYANYGLKCCVAKALEGGKSGIIYMNNEGGK